MNKLLGLIGAAVGCFLPATSVLAQTLEETAFFIMTGNAAAQFEDLGDRFKLKKNTDGGGVTLKLTPDEQEGDVFVMKMSPDTCVFQMETVTQRPHRTTGKVRPVKTVVRVDFGKIDPSNVTEGVRPIGNGYGRSVLMRGASSDINCKWLETPEDGKIPVYCLPAVSIDPSSMGGNYDRAPKAIKHLYGTYCKGTKKAF